MRLCAIFDVNDVQINSDRANGGLESRSDYEVLLGISFWIALCADVMTDLTVVVAPVNGEVRGFNVRPWHDSVGAPESVEIYIPGNVDHHVVAPIDGLLTEISVYSLNVIEPFVNLPQSYHRPEWTGETASLAPPPMHPDKIRRYTLRFENAEQRVIVWLEVGGHQWIVNRFVTTLVDRIDDVAQQHHHHDAIHTWQLAVPVLRGQVLGELVGGSLADLFVLPAVVVGGDIGTSVRSVRREPQLVLDATLVAGRTQLYRIDKNILHVYCVGRFAQRNEFEQQRQCEC